MFPAKTTPFTLYEYRASPFCVAIRIALNECAVTFTAREVDLKKARTAAFLKRSPFGRLPSLVEHRPGGELAIFESSAILLFLTDRFAESSLGFDDLEAKVQSLSWLSVISSGLSEYVLSALNEMIDINKLKYTSDSIILLKKHLYVLNKHLARRAYLAGDYSIADTLATPMLDLLEKIKSINLENYNNIISWRERLRNRPSYKGVWPYNKAE